MDHTAWPKNPHACVGYSCGPIRLCGPYGQFGLARVAHTAILWPSHGYVLHTTMSLLTIRPCPLTQPTTWVTTRPCDVDSGLFQLFMKPYFLRFGYALGIDLIQKQS
ncbi:hypothetical protein PVK06_026195 [Gossypium arboreum]|uniref:Uncharacterized protein n=1 Tax=Gossypium arboreum TaxID=29729 RepID=A0ABR0NX24_GOSAR|nr:hypothetical protein PVK06_026195 [Gossypium arboreum]